MISRNTNIQQASGKRIGDIADEIDASGFRGFSPTEVADRVEGDLGGFYRDPISKSETSLLDNALESIRMRGEENIGLAEAQALKKTLAKTANWKNNIQPTQKEILAREIYGTVTEMIDSATDQGAKSINDPELLKAFVDAKKLYGASKGSQEILLNKRAREEGNKMFGLTDSIFAAGGIGAAVAIDPAAIAATAAVLGAKKLGEKYGAQNMARGSDSMAKQILRVPELAKKYGSVLQSAATRGPTALAATHYILQQQDPEYREKMRETGYDPSDAEETN